MSETLYLTGPVIVNGVADSDGDTLNSVEIRTIFTKYTNHLSDVQHDRIDYDGIDILANWISENDTTIAGKTVPAKSWIATIKVTNPEVIESVQNGKLTCFSLGSVSEDAKTSKSWFIDKRISYHDLKSIESVIPLRISIVDAGANGFPFEIADYETYINKSRGKENMTENNIEDAKFSIKEFLGLKKVFDDEKSIDKAEEPAPETDTAEQNVQALFDKLDTLLEEIAGLKEQISSLNINKEEKETDEEKEEEEKIEKEKEEDIEKSETEEINKSEEEEESDEEVEINKSETKKPADIPVDPNSSFFERTGRDLMGRKIRK